MSTSSATTLITGAATDFGTAALVVLGAVLVIGVGLLIFRWGWRKVRGSAR